jgi:septal ring factor EnvC (AmiA/AmiB activator)
VAVLAGLALIVTSAVPVGAAGDTKAERDEVREKQAGVAKDVDTLNATTSEVKSALDALDSQVSATEAKLVAAQSASEDAAKALDAAQRAEQQAEQAVADMQDAVNELAVNAFVAPPDGGFIETLQSDDLSEAVLKRTFIDVRSERDFDALDLLTKAQNDLENARSIAEDVAKEADDALAAVDDRFAEVTAARADQAKVVEDVQARLDQKLGEAAALADLDQELSAQLQNEQEELAAKITAQNRAREQSATSSPAPSSPSAPAAPVVNIPSSGSLRTVGGITVSTSIAGNLERMLNSARAAGHNFGGGGYRSSQGQINTRRNNCGTSNYAIYQMSPSQCRPPTARPGTSMHERGLAVDFTYNGSLIRSRSNSGFRWLAANAASYGFYNLPSEPWHWSSNGN